MKMYEAMRLGSMMWEQAFGVGWSLDGKRCAVVTATSAACVDRFPVYSLKVPCPLGCSHAIPSYFIGEESQPTAHVNQVCAHLNDKHRWTREKIADWLEPIEEKFLSSFLSREEEKDLTYVHK